VSFFRIDTEDGMSWHSGKISPDLSNEQGTESYGDRRSSTLIGG
jgi:hypothetical protein